MPQLVGREVGKVGYGLIGLTTRGLPQEKAIECLRAAITSGATFWNAGEIYGTPESNSLHLLHAYFTKYPEDASKVTLSIKGSCNPGTIIPNNSRENITRSIEECLRVLDGKKSIDIFEPCRIDPNVPVEEMMGYLKEWVEKGAIGGIGLSEVNKDTIRKAHAVHPVAAVEVEMSLWCPNPLENGVAKTCAELGIPIVAYSPLGRGFLTGKFKKPDDLPQSFVRIIPRAAPENFEHNARLGWEIEKLAEKKGVQASQMALAWIAAHSGRNGLGIFIPIPGTNDPGRVKENSTDVELTDEDVKTLDELRKTYAPIGDRYPPGSVEFTDL